MSTPDAAIQAFRKAQQLLTDSPVARLELAALDLNTDDWNGLSGRVEKIRRALVDGYRAQGARVTDDYDGTMILGRLFPNEGDDFNEVQSQFTHREQAGYLYGLAIGLLLGRGGAR